MLIELSSFCISSMAVNDPVCSMTYPDISCSLSGQAANSTDNRLKKREY
jgi:hypothetical protein